MDNQEFHRVKVGISVELLTQMITGDFILDDDFVIKTTKGIPKDAKFIEVVIEQNRTVILVYEHESFEAISLPGRSVLDPHEIPWFDPVISRIENEITP